MDNERITGGAQKIKVTVEKTVGKLVGNPRWETDGKVGEAAGDIRKGGRQSQR